jgi:hypothetical protein
VPGEIPVGPWLRFLFKGDARGAQALGSPRGVARNLNLQPFENGREQSGLQGAPTAFLEAIEKAGLSRLAGKAKGPVVSSLTGLERYTRHPC